MHSAPLFRETNLTVLMKRAKANPFALVTAVTEDGLPVAAHTPVLLDNDGTDLTLRFHLARMNLVAIALQAAPSALIVFSGPEAYVSPDWYGTDDQVPTWNYLSVEAAGTATPLDGDDTARFLDDLSAESEGGLLPKPPWTRGKMSPGKFEGMLKAIIGFQLVPARFEGVTKLNQNKPADARARVADQLGETKGGMAIADAMRKLSP